MAEKKMKEKTTESEKKKLVLSLEKFGDKVAGPERRISLGVSFPKPVTFMIISTSDARILTNWLTGRRENVTTPIGVGITEGDGTIDFLRFLIGSNYIVYRNDHGIPDIKDFLFYSGFTFVTYNSKQSVTRLVRHVNMKKGNLNVKRKLEKSSSENYIALESLLGSEKRLNASHIDELEEIVKPLLRLIKELQ